MTSADHCRLLPSATSLLSMLSNPLNITLLASHLLANDVLYSDPLDLGRCRQVFSVFYTAALRFIEDQQSPARESVRSSLHLSSWVRAVVQGADDKSPRWRHTLLIGAVLLALQSKGHEGLSADLRHKLEGALVTASNLALEQLNAAPNGPLAVVFVLNHTFPILSGSHSARLNVNLLLPVLVDAAFFSREGLEHGYWLGLIDEDVRETKGKKFTWSSTSNSFCKVTEIKSRPFVSGLGALSRLISHSIDNVQDRALIVHVTDRIADFARNLAMSWRQNKLSEVEPVEEAQFLDPECLGRTLPVLLQLLRDSMFAIIITLRAILGRLLCDSLLAADGVAPGLATRCLRTLHDTHFISHRFGQTSTSQYIFVNFAAVDILNQYPAQAESFLSSIRPSEPGRVPAHPLDRLNDLFFLNTAEHFTLTLSSRVSEELLLNAAMPYVNPRGDDRLGEIYEAAHSVVLAVLAVPHNAEIAARHVPFYVETLLQSFPAPLTPRQFRLAIKSVVRIAAPPSPIAASMPLMQAIVLELLKERMDSAAEESLPPHPDVPVEAKTSSSEKAVLLLAIIDCLSFLPVPLLEEWLPMTAEQLRKIGNPAQRLLCQQRLWEVLSSGEMDVERAAVCVGWWNSRGGREHVLYGEPPDDPEFVMSGAIQYDSKL